MAEQNLTTVTPQMQKAITIREFINKPVIRTQIEAAMMKGMDPERFMRVFYSAMLLNPDILDCSQASLLSCMIQSAQINLEPVLGWAALIPYKKICTFQPMYRGLIQLARRAMPLAIVSDVVYMKDEFKIISGSNQRIEHVKNIRVKKEADLGDKLGAYTIWKYIRERTETSYFMPTWDIFDVRDKYSRAWQAKGKNSPWGQRENEMMKKTVIKAHSKTEPVSLEMEYAINLDNRSDNLGVDPASTVGRFMPDASLPEVTGRFQEAEKKLGETPLADMAFGGADLFSGQQEQEPEKGPEPKPPAERFMAFIQTWRLDAKKALQYVEYLSKHQGQEPNSVIEALLSAEQTSSFTIQNWRPPVKEAPPGGEPAGGLDPNRMPNKEQLQAYRDKYKHARKSVDMTKGRMGYVIAHKDEIATWPKVAIAELYKSCLQIGYMPDVWPQGLLTGLEPVAKPPVQPPVQPPAAGGDEPPHPADSGAVDPNIKAAQEGLNRRAVIERKLEEWVSGKLRKSGLDDETKYSFPGFINDLGRQLDFYPTIKASGIKDIGSYMARLVEDEGLLVDAMNAYLESVYTGEET